ncbi:preprotein translocase subunit SecF [Caenibius tardaugens NBRC 16725]|uniref:Protein-export membrane protein SecF n=1 Tax=Caenibius tardaugens NBRC 16725 TaxID=1219035 RepID=U2ZQG7_9SPHN|nr:protein translocase subunit SecF [Caenibius tardaugens]AZI37141.1 protein translocase subunit SecF [Caenibius tardaugens NBRC 16725]GAD47619.1 preprotein translocase subunit SecF [Caenibius tardaugens NBRC 16725]
MKLLKLVPDNTNIHFLKWQWPFFISNILAMIGAVVLLFTHGLNLGVDFVGGQMIRATFVESTVAPVADLRESVGKLGYGEPIIQQFGKPNEVSIRMKLPEGAEDHAELADAMANKITGTLKQTYPGVRIDGVDSVSGKVSGELFKTGMLALLLAMVGISIYIWVRFEWQFGVGALFALVQDLLLTIGMFSLTQMEFDLNIVAALLTLLGYSLNDKIVVYDRIRENLKKYRKMPMPELLDLSVNETLSRTVATSLAVLIMLFSLLLLGPDVIFGFTAAITLGIFVGTYSSIFMSAPILIWLGVTQSSFVPADSGSDSPKKAAIDEA